MCELVRTNLWKIRSVTALATFLAYMNHALCKYMDMIVICYVDDIVVYLLIIKSYTEQVQLVLQKLRKYSLYIKILKCIFDAEKIDFLSFKVGQYRISMNLSKVNTIATWLVLKLFWEI